LWKDKKNIRITYAKYEVKNTQNTGQMPPLDDHVQYQKIGHEKVNHVRGISRPVDLAGVEHGLAFSWRGKGLLMIATSDWEILGWGQDDQADPASQWAVTYFGKTLFTPAGIDIYSRSIHGVSSSTLAKIKQELTMLLGGELSGISDAIFEIPQE
jgi:hypothetical protein